MGGGFDREGPGAAHRIEEGLRGLPAGEGEDAGGEGLAERGGGGVEAPAAAVEAIAGGVDGEREDVVFDADPEAERAGGDSGAAQRFHAGIDDYVLAMDAYAFGTSQGELQ